MFKRHNFWLQLGLLIALVLIVAYFFPNLGGASTGKGLSVRYIDVGHGEAILISCENQHMLIDAGPAASSKKLISYLDNFRLRTIDYVVATHPHGDHIGGMASVLQNFQVGLFIMPDAAGNSVYFEDMLDAIADNHCETSYAQAGDRYAIGNAFATVLSPQKGMYSENLNDYSVVILLEYQGFSFLFTGDAEAQTELALLPSLPDTVDVLKVAHHGSSTSTTPEFLDAVSPVSYAVICCGAGNDYGHPHKAVLDRLTAAGAEIYRTDVSSNILINVTEGKMNVYTDR